MNKNLRKIVAVAAFSAIVMAAFGGCASKTKSNASAGSTDNSKPLPLSVMLTSYTTNTLADNSQVKQKLEEMTNTKLNFTWIPSTSYPDKLNITLASGDLPNIILAPDKTSSILSGVKAGAFWEIGPYLKSYTNLSKANADVMWNTSIDGKYYGIYRSRPYGRNGITYRKDWLANLGLSVPKTTDDLYNVIKAFTLNDPDKNGKNDTYGLAASKSNMSFYMSEVWFGAPNRWGLDSNGKLAPDFTFSEYKDTLNFWKKLYTEKLINQDFAVFEPTKVADMYNTGKAGVLIDVADQAQRSDETMAKTDASLLGKTTGVIGAVSGPKGLRNQPTTGYNGMFMFPKSSNKTEADLKNVLKFMNQLDDKDVQILINNGIENVTFKLVDGYTQPLNPAADPTIFGEINQLALGLGTNNMYLPTQTETRKTVAKVQEENIKTAIANPATPLISQTYTTKGAQLDNIIEDARVKYIVGQMDAKGFDAAVQQWKSSGGDQVIKEYNDEYAKYKK